MACCPLCEKKFEDRRGLHGHFRFVHGIEYGSGKPAKKTVLTEAIKRSIKRRKEGERMMKEMEDKGMKMKNKREWGDNSFIDGIEGIEIRREDRKFVNKVEFE